MFRWQLGHLPVRNEQVVAEPLVFEASAMKTGRKQGAHPTMPGGRPHRMTTTQLHCI